MALPMRCALGLGQRLGQTARAAARCYSCSTALPKLSWLDLRGAGLSAAERLAIEELLLRHDPLGRCWGIVGLHEPTQNKILNFPLPPHDWKTQRKLAKTRIVDGYGHENEGQMNRSCTIIMGIGGKPERLIDIDAARNDGVLILRRFSGGGTVVVDHSSLWTTFIGRNSILPHVKPYPREIMQWSVDAIFRSTFKSWGIQTSASRLDKPKGSKRTLVFQGKSCGLSGGVGESLILSPTQNETQQVSSAMPQFQLRENDYVLGERKIGGNAQAIVKDGWIHHTSFLYDYVDKNMEYLTLPEKRPDYRGKRSHDDFLVRMKDHYGVGSNKNAFFEHVKRGVNESFELEEMTLNDVLVISMEKFGGFQEWWDTDCRTKVVKL
jgi:lipoate-protein ligase A